MENELHFNETWNIYYTNYLQSQLHVMMVVRFLFFKLCIYDIWNGNYLYNIKYAL